MLVLLLTSSVFVKIKSMICRCHFILLPFILQSAEIRGLGEEILHQDILKIRTNIFNLTTFLFDDVEMTNADIVYYLFTRKHRNVTITNSLSLVNRKYPIKMLVHGWTEHVHARWYEDIINAYLKRGFYNIIPVDWSAKGDTDYLSASRNSKAVGDRIGKFIANLHKKMRISLKNIHLLSHSLGAHVAGFVGQKVFEMTGKKIGRITAMDPAAPLFDFNISDDLRLSKDDARFVDVIHTDGGMLGFRYPIGTVDFFPNGGSAIQPGCSLLKLEIKFDDFFCSHASSHQLYIKSINHRKFHAKSCESWEQYSTGLCKSNKTIVFGEDVPVNAKGSYYLQTRDEDITL